MQSENGPDTMDLERFNQIEHPVDRKIVIAIETLAESTNGSGVAISSIVRRMQGVPEKEIQYVTSERCEKNSCVYRERIGNLIGDGYVFTAEDDNHVLSTFSN